MHTTQYGGLILEHWFVPQLSSLGVKVWGLEVSDFRVRGSGYKNQKLFKNLKVLKLKDFYEIIRDNIFILIILNAA